MLLLTRGVKRCEKVVSSIFWLWPLIQPWQRASSTASSRLRDVGDVVFFLARVNVTPGEVALLEASQFDQEVASGIIRVGRGFIVRVGWVSSLMDWRVSDKGSYGHWPRCCDA